VDWPKAGNVGIPVQDPAWETAVLEDGEMIVRGPGLFTGYWNKPEETKSTLRDGWLYTGDIAEVGADGNFKLVDRKKEIINTSGGKTVSPTEVAKANNRLARAEQIKAFRILPEELSPENGVMTPTRKKRRKQLMERYQSLIDTLYDESEEKLIKAQVGQ
jgi:long-subunit acyl-CoA synthetase (AMP-forming)